MVNENIRRQEREGVNGAIVLWPKEKKAIIVLSYFIPQHTSLLHQLSQEWLHAFFLRLVKGSWHSPFVVSICCIHQTYST